MRPVGSPQHAARSSLDQLASKRNGVVERRTGARDALRTGDFDPALLVARQQCQQLLEGRLLRAGRRIHQSHVIDHVRARAAPPAEGSARRAVTASRYRSTCQPSGAIRSDEAIEGIHVGSAAQARHEREAAAVQPAGGERVELAVSHPLVDIADAAIAAATLRNRIEDHPVVATVRRGVDNDGALDADARVQRLECGKRGLGRRVRTRRRVGVCATGPKMWQCASQVSAEARNVGARGAGSGPGIVGANSGLCACARMVWLVNANADSPPVKWPSRASASRRSISRATPRLAVRAPREARRCQAPALPP